MPGGGDNAAAAAHLAEGAEAVGVDGTLVHEDLLGAIVRGDEPKALLGVEPLHLRCLRGQGEKFSGC
jgi:hypothetical protein